MSSMKSEIKACVCESLSEGLDEQLASNDFSRRKNSLIYSRRLPKADQRIEVVIEIHPADCPNAAAAIYPWLEVSMDSVNSVAKEMVGSDETLLGGLPDTTMREPIEFTSPKGIGSRWFIYQPDSVPGVVSEMKCFLQQWGIPFLDYYTSPDAICDAYDRGDERVINDRTQKLRVVAAMVLLDRVGDAMKVAEKWFGKAGPRKQCRSVFSYLESRSATT